MVYLLRMIIGQRWGLETFCCCRYSGMIAWRGVVDGNAHPELLKELQADFTTLGKGIIFDIADRCMNLIYMIPGNRINWLW